MNKRILNRIKAKKQLICGHFNFSKIYQPNLFNIVTSYEKDSHRISFLYH